MKYAALLLVLSGCVTMLPAPGRTMMQAPADVPFCGGSPVRVVNVDKPHNMDMPGVEDCTALLQNYPALYGDDSWKCSIDFVLTVDGDGGVVDVCVKGGNFGNVPDYVSCLAAKARKRHGLPAGRQPWRVQYIYD